MNPNYNKSSLLQPTTLEIESPKSIDSENNEDHNHQNRFSYDQDSHPSSSFGHSMTQSSNRNADVLMNLLRTYTSFYRDTNNFNLDLENLLQQVIRDMKAMKPPQGKLQNIWDSISCLNKNEIEDYSQKLKQLPPEVLFEVLLNSEKLNLKLNLEFEQEINRGRSLGLINDKQELS